MGRSAPQTRTWERPLGERDEGWGARGGGAAASKNAKKESGAGEVNGRGQRSNLRVPGRESHPVTGGPVTCSPLSTPRETASAGPCSCCIPRWAGVSQPCGGRLSSAATLAALGKASSCRGSGAQSAGLAAQLEPWGQREAGFPQPRTGPYSGPSCKSFCNTEVSPS